MPSEPEPPLSHQIVDIALVILIRAFLGVAGGGMLGLILANPIARTLDPTPYDALGAAVAMVIGGFWGGLIGLIVGLFLAYRRLKGRGANIFPA
jgi:hypothetical protein